MSDYSAVAPPQNFTQSAAFASALQRARQVLIVTHLTTHFRLVTGRPPVFTCQVYSGLPIVLILMNARPLRGPSSDLTILRSLFYMRVTFSVLDSRLESSGAKFNSFFYCNVSHGTFHPGCVFYPVKCSSFRCIILTFACIPSNLFIE